MKKFFSLLLTVLLFVGVTTSVSAYPSQPLVSVEILDHWYFSNSNDKIYICVEEVGISRDTFVWVDGILIKEDVNERQRLTEKGSNIIYGYRKFYPLTDRYWWKEGKDIYKNNSPGEVYEVQVKATNNFNPWNTISRGKTMRLWK